MTSPPSRAWLPVAAVGVTLVLWASAFVAIRHLGRDFSPGALALGRTAVGALALAALAIPRRLRRPTRNQWWRLVAIGFLWYAVYNVALNEGELRVDAGTAALILQSAPVMLAVLAALFLREPFTPMLGVGLAIAVAGVTLISLSGSSDGTGSDLVGVLLCALSAFVYAVSVVLQKPLMTTLPAIQVTWVACAVGAVACLPYAGTLVDEVAKAPAASVWWVVYLGVFPTAIGFTCYAYALNHMSASNLGVTTYLVPVITIAMAWVLLSEVPAPLAYVGGVVTLVGVAVTRRRPRDRAEAPAPAERGRAPQGF